MIDWLSPAIGIFPTIYRYLKPAKKSLTKKEFEKVLRIIIEELLAGSPDYDYIEAELGRIKEKSDGSREYHNIKKAYSRAREFAKSKPAVLKKCAKKKTLKKKR